MDPFLLAKEVKKIDFCWFLAKVTLYQVSQSTTEELIGIVSDIVLNELKDYYDGNYDSEDLNMTYSTLNNKD